MNQENKIAEYFLCGLIIAGICCLVLGGSLYDKHTEILRLETELAKVEGDKDYCFEEWSSCGTIKSALSRELDTCNSNIDFYKALPERDYIGEINALLEKYHAVRWERDQLQVSLDACRGQVDIPANIDEPRYDLVVQNLCDADAACSACAVMTVGDYSFCWRNVYQDHKTQCTWDMCLCNDGLEGCPDSVLEYYIDQAVCKTDRNCTGCMSQMIDNGGGLEHDEILWCLTHAYYK